MRTLFLLLSPICLFLFSCKGEPKRSEAMVPTDSIVAEAADTTNTDTIAPPAAVDGLFDDFMYNYMHNAKFQRARTVFPLSRTIDGRIEDLKPAAWKHDWLYAHEDLYTMLFDDKAAMAREKDPHLDHTVVERIDFPRRRVRQYTFGKINGKWMLTAIDEHRLERNANADFYTFYHDFATNEDFRHRHIQNPFEYQTYDSDAFQKIEGLLDVAQWADFAPPLPDGVVMNINYGQRGSGTGQRILVVAGSSAGLSSTLYFRKKRGSWMLTRLESL